MRPHHLRTTRLGCGLWAPDDLDLARWIGGPFSGDQMRERLERELATQTVTACSTGRSSFWKEP